MREKCCYSGMEVHTIFSKRYVRPDEDLQPTLVRCLKCLRWWRREIWYTEIGMHAKWKRIYWFNFKLQKRIRE